MKSKGFVRAASITSQTSSSMRSQSSASSFTSAVFTVRNVASRRWTISAARVELTDTTESTTVP